MERDKKSQQADYLLTILLKILKVVKIWSWSAPLSFKYWINLPLSPSKSDRQ